MHLDTYDLRARVLPALLVAAPALALAVTMPLGLQGLHRLWSLVGLAVWPLAIALMRRFGNAVQPKLWASWGGPPATDRLRWSSNTPVVTAARHAEVKSVLGAGVRLPTATVERRDPAAADAIYGDVVRRLLGRTRANQTFALLHRENANYGFARNLYGARTFALGVAGSTLVVVLGIAAHQVKAAGIGAVTPLLLPGLVALAALLVWGWLITPELVRPPADALADRLMDALQLLAEGRLAP